MQYTLQMEDGTEIQIAPIELVKQVYGFVQFLDEDGDLVIAIRAEKIFSYSPTVKTPVVPVITRKKVGIKKPGK